MEYKVVIPNDFFTVFKFMQEDRLGVAAINTALRELEYKVVFGWHLSIMLHFDKVRKNGLPNETSHKKVEKFESQLSKWLNPILKKPNALFLGRVTWNKTAELIWRVHNPEETNKVIQNTLQEKLYPFPFDYRIDPDTDWNLAEWHLKEREYEIDDN